MICNRAWPGNNYDCWNAPTDTDPTFEYEHGDSSSSASVSDFSMTSSNKSEASNDNPVRYYYMHGHTHDHDRQWVWPTMGMVWGYYVGCDCNTACLVKYIFTRGTLSTRPAVTSI